MFRRRKTSRKSGDGENPFLLSFSDFMASLLAIFILIVIVEVVQLKKKEAMIAGNKDYIPILINEYNKLKALEKEAYDLLTKMSSIVDSMQAGINNSLKKAGERRRILEGVITSIEADLLRQGVAVNADIPNLCLRFRNDKSGETGPKKLLFASGQSQIPKESEETVAIIGTSLMKALKNIQNIKTKNTNVIDTVFIEGHTDSTGKNDQMLNWRLSTERALSIWQFWTVNPGNHKELKELKSAPDNSDPRPLISVSGYADTRSTLTDDEKRARGDDRPEDRRIEIRFTLAPSEKNSVVEVQDTWNSILIWFPGKIKRLREILDAP